MGKLAVFIPLNRNIYPFGDKIKRFMDKCLNNNIGIASAPSGPRNDAGKVNWEDNPAIQGLLNVVIGIMAEEYIETARNNGGVFSAPETENTFVETDPSTACPSDTSLGMTEGKGEK